jgi:GNAT superfamily N-acetyltransferase
MPCRRPDIRPANPGDFAAIVRICKSSMAATYGGFLDQEKMRPWVEGEATDNYVSSMLGDMIVAVDGDRIDGVVAIAGDTIDLVWVAIERRGRGIGTALMAAAEHAIRTRGQPKARLEVFEPNRDAIRFYEARGWLRQDSYPDQMAGVDKVLMTKDLAALSDQVARPEPGASGAGGRLSPRQGAPPGRRAKSAAG